MILQCKPGENSHYIHMLIVASTGMAAYHMKGNKIHSALCTDIN